jgi:hypothetical protein
MKCILRYLCGTIDFGLLRRSSTTELRVYTFVDWVGCPDMRRSTSSYVVFLGDNLVSWSSKRQPVVSRSSAEAEYRVVANGVAEAAWLHQLLQELHSPMARSTLVFCDNVSVVYLSTNPVQHQRTKHVVIDLHFVCERVTCGDVRVLHVPTASQFADVFTKGLPTTVFAEFRSSFNICMARVSTAGVVRVLCTSPYMGLMFAGPLGLLECYVLVPIVKAHILWSAYVYATVPKGAIISSNQG